MDRAYLRRQYPRLGDFVRLADRFDPERKVRNRWLDELLGEEEDGNGERNDGNERTRA